MSKSAHTDAYAAVVAALKELRVSKGVSQVELARRLGRPQQFVSYLEAGIRRIDLVEFVVIVRALGGDAAQLSANLARQISLEAKI
jgi:transcriptional regulator with XRE-family HTH domain